MRWPTSTRPNGNRPVGPDPHAGHGHGPLPAELEERSRRADRGLRTLLVGIVAPLALLTMGGLVVLWPRHLPVVPPSVAGANDQARATVITSAHEPCPDEQGGPAETCQVAHLRLKSGPDNGTLTTLTFNIVANSGIPELAAGNGVIVQRFHAPNGGSSYFFVDLERGTPLWWLTIGFAVLVVALARWKGFAALIGLAVTLAVLVKFILPAILAGKNPVAVSIVGCSLIMFVVFYVAHGITVRSTTALVGTLISLGLTGILAVISVKATHLTGAASEETIVIKATAGQVNLRGLLLGGIIIGGLGVLNDVTITQSSAVWQLAIANPASSARNLYHQGMVIGRDHIGATVDTLVLAYAGAAMPLLVFFTIADRSLSQVLTSAVVAEEVVRSLVGAIGLVASVPITTALAAILSAGARKTQPT